MPDISKIRAHVESMPNIRDLHELDNGGIKFVIDESYAVEVYYSYPDHAYVLANNEFFDPDGKPLMGCWEFCYRDSEEEVIEMLNDTSDWY